MPADNNIIVRDSASAGPLIAQADIDRARAYAEASIAASTKRAYTSAWRVFTSWCRGRGHRPLPAHPAVVAAFVADRAEQKAVGTVEEYLAAINEAHRLSDLPVPTREMEVRVVMKGIRRTHGTAQQGKAPLLVSHLRRIVEVLPEGVIGVRDRALLLFGFAGALRRSELVALDVEDFDFRDEGLAVTIRRSKTDQQGARRLVGLPYGSNPATCPVRATRGWLCESSAEAGPVFRSVDRRGHISPGRLSGKAVGLVVKRSVACGSPGDRDHGPDRTSVGHHPPGLHQGGHPVHRRGNLTTTRRVRRRTWPRLRLPEPPPGRSGGSSRWRALLQVHPDGSEAAEDDRGRRLARAPGPRPRRGVGHG